MPWVKGSEKQKAKWVTVKDFAKHFSLPRSSAYAILKRIEMKDAIRYLGEKTIRVNLPLADEILKQLFN